MSALAQINQSSFAHIIHGGMSAPRKHVQASQLFDDVGQLLFAAMERLPGYGMARAEHSILKRYKGDLARRLDPHAMRPKILRVDLTTAQVGCCSVESWLSEARIAVAKRAGLQPLLVMVPRGLMGILDRAQRNAFLFHLHSLLQPGDFLLFGADLLKEPATTLSAYNDPSGIVAAFNKNLLTRINRELSGHFDLTRFAHQAKWDAFLRRSELHLMSIVDQDVYIGLLGQRFRFAAGETIHTASFYQWSELELEELAKASGFEQLKGWTDVGHSFAEVLWQA